MPFTVNDRGLYEGLARLVQAQSTGIDEGLQEGADVWQADLQSTRAHGDMSGATRGSYRAYVIGNGHNGAAESASGYAAAQQALTGFAGHAGKALSQSVNVALGTARGILATAFTSYQDKLETELGGAKATLGPSATALAQTFTALVARGVRNRLR